MTAIDHSCVRSICPNTVADRTRGRARGIRSSLRAAMPFVALARSFDANAPFVAVARRCRRLRRRIDFRASNVPSVLDELTAHRRQRNRGRAHDESSSGGVTIGIDYGIKRIGVAVSNGFGAPRALDALANDGSRTTSRAIEAILRVIRAEGAEAVVVGAPKEPNAKARRKSGNDASGAEGIRVKTRGRVNMERTCVRFAREVADACARSSDLRDVDVFTCDETLTSKEAVERLAMSGRKSDGVDDLVDSVAAAVLLERYFDGSYGAPKKVEPFA